MRITTAFNRMLAIPGATVSGVGFTPAGVVVLRRRSKLLICPCGFTSRATYDRSIRRRRHLHLGAWQLLLESEIRRLECLRCQRVRTEQVPWARPGARHTKDIEDVGAFLAQRTDKTTIVRLLRILAAVELGLSNSKLKGSTARSGSSSPRLGHRSGGSDLDDLPLLRRNYHPAAHGKVRRTRFRPTLTSKE